MLAPQPTSAKKQGHRWKHNPQHTVRPKPNLVHPVHGVHCSGRLAAAVASASAAFLYQSTLSGDPVRASLMATAVFSVGRGVVLHIIGTARLKGVLSGSGHIDDDQHPCRTNRLCYKGRAPLRIEPTLCAVRIEDRGWLNSDEAVLNWRS